VGLSDTTLGALLATINTLIHPDRSMTAHPVGGETRSRVLQSGGITIKLIIRGTSAGFADAR